MNWVLIIVVALGAVVSIASAAAKKKAAAEQARRQKETVNSGAQTPTVPRPSTMSDIQRAFMEMSGLTEEPAKAPASSVYSGSAGSAVPMNSTEGRTVKSESLGSYEGAYSTEGRSGTSEGLGSYEGAYSTEGKAGETEGSEFHSFGTHSYTGKYAEVDLSTLKIDAEEDLSTLRVDLDESLKPSYSGADAAMRKRNPLKLFANKDEFTKAVIYSEILNRRAR